MNQKLFKIFITLFGMYSLYFVICAIFAPLCAYLHLYDLSGKLSFAMFNVCHQNPERCFWVLGYPMPLCARCFGVYLGTFVSSIFNIRISKKLFIILSIITIIDIFINYGIRINTGNMVRLFVGFGMGLLIVTCLEYIFVKEKR